MMERCNHSNAHSATTFIVHPWCVHMTEKAAALARERANFVCPNCTKCVVCEDDGDEVNSFL